MCAHPHGGHIHEGPAAFPLELGAEGTPVRPERRGVHQHVDERHEGHRVLVPLDGVGLEVARAVDAHEAGQLEVDVLEAQARPVEHQGAVGRLVGHGRHRVPEALVHDVLEQAVLSLAPLGAEGVVGRLRRKVHREPSLEEPAEHHAAPRVVGPLEVLRFHLGQGFVRGLFHAMRMERRQRQGVSGLHHTLGGWRGYSSNEQTMWREPASSTICRYLVGAPYLTRTTDFNPYHLTRTGQWPCLS